MEKESLSPLIPPDTTASENEEQENFEETAQPSIKVPTESINAPSNEEEKNPDEDSLLIFEEDSMEKSKCGLNLCF
jgi:hypothetical protein